MVNFANPQPGDVVVESRQLSTGPVYVVRPAAGAAQYFVHSRDEAVSRAIQFAERLGVRAWLIDQGRTCALDDLRKATANR